MSADLDHTPNTPPHDAQTERALIGAALLDAAVLDRVNIPAADFYRPAHETMWTALIGINGSADRPVALADHLDTAGDLARIGGASYIHDCVTACLTPIAADQYADIIQRHARHRRATQAIQRAAQALDTVDPAAALEIAMDALEAEYRNQLGQRGTGHTTWAALNLDAALNGQEVDPPPTCGPRADGHYLLYAGAVHSLSGEPTAGKSWIALLWVLHELQQGNHVTYIDLEDRASRVVGRLLMLGASPDQIRAHFRYVRPHHPLADDARRDLERVITATTLVIIDGVTEAMTMHGLDLESNRGVAEFYDLLPRWITNHGPAVLLIDHVVKDPERQGRWGIGGQHKLAGLDGCAYVVKNVEPLARGKRGLSRIVVSKDRGGYVEEIAVGRNVADFTLDATIPDILRASLDVPTAMPTDDTGDIRPTILMGRVAQYLTITPGATQTAIRQGVRGKEKFVLRALECLIHEGYVEQSDGSRGAKYHHLAQPFNEGEEPDD